MSVPHERLSGLHLARADHGVKADRLATYLREADPLADDAVRELFAQGYGKAWPMIERALAGGIASVPDAPPALRRLFESTPAP